MKLGWDEKDTSGMACFSVLSRLSAFSDLRIMIFLLYYLVYYIVCSLYISFAALCFCDCDKNVTVGR